MKRAPSKPRCIGCGCTEDRACPVENGDGTRGCSWIMLDLRRRVGLCSSCATSVQQVFGFLAPLDPDPREEAQGSCAEDIAAYLGMPVSTVRKALLTLEERGLATPVDKEANVVYWCAPSLDESLEPEGAELDVDDRAEAISRLVNGPERPDFRRVAALALGEYVLTESIEYLEPVDPDPIVQRLERMRDAVIAHLMVRDTKGALAAAFAQRDEPELFDRMIFDGDTWVVWSWEHGGWWAPYELGYVRELAAAGEYSKARALEIQENANRFRPEDEPNEKAMPKAHAARFDPGVRHV